MNTRVQAGTRGRPSPSAREKHKLGEPYKTWIYTNIGSRDRPPDTSFRAPGGDHVPVSPLNRLG